MTVKQPFVPVVPGYQQIKKFSWESSVRLEIYSEVVGGSDHHDRHPAAD
jgi:hypothetical protein